MGKPQNCNCQCSGPPLWFGYQRRFSCVGPVLGDTSVSGHTADWKYDRALHWYSNIYVWPDTPPFWCYYSTAGSHTVGDSFFPATVKLRPIRFRLDNILIRGMPWVGDDHLFFTPPNRVQRSGVAAPATADGHFSGSRISSVAFDQGALSQVDAGPSRIVAARLLVNGVDVSGVVTVNHGFSLRPGVQYRGYWPSAASPSITLPSPITLSGGETIEVDFWIEMRVTLDPTTGAIPFNSGLRESLIYGVGPFNQIDQLTHPWAKFVPMIAALGTHELYNRNNPFYFVTEPVCTPGQINVHRRLRDSDTWTLTFSGTTFGGLSTLVLQPQSGWSYVRQGAMIVMTKNASPGTGATRLEFRYDTETPEIRIQVPAGHAANGGMGLRYHCPSPSYYQPHSNFNVAHGPVTASGTNTFTPSVVSYQTTNRWLPATLYTSYGLSLSGYPSSIAAVRS